MAIDIRNNTFFLISLGAILGALFRWQINEIFIVNSMGSFLLGFFNSLDILKRYKLTLWVGFCGSMTTFSSWMSHLYKLLNQGLYKLFLLNSLSIVLMGVLAICLGHIFAKKLNA